MKFIFLFLLIIHSVASLAVLPLVWRQGLWLVGIFLAFIWMKKLGLEKESLAKEKDTGISFWLWLVLPILAVLFRVFRFFGAPVWPIGDEYETAQAGFQLSHHWSWDFFRSDGESPPLLDWMVGALFKYSNHIIAGLWAPPFVISCLTFVVVFLTVQRFFSRTQSFFICFFWATSFWPVFCQGLALQETLLPLWEWVLFFIWLSYGENTSDPGRFWMAAALGLWAGLGYWTYVPWPVVIAALFIGVFYSWHKGRWNNKAVAGLFLGFGITLIPFLMAVSRHGYGTHIRVLASTDGNLSIPRLLVSLDYINSLFWGHWSALSAYVPTDSGLLNPIEAAFFWIGIWALLIQNSSKFNRWIGLSFFLFLAPGLLSRNLQILRIIPIMPLVLSITALGAVMFFRTFSKWKTGIVFLAIFFLSSIAFNGGKTAVAFQRIESNSAPERFAANYLSNMNKEKGPGIIFTEFNVSKDDAQNLQTMVYSFNAVQNPKLDLSRVRWAAFWVTRDQQTILGQNFRLLHWWYPPNFSEGQNSYALGWMNVTPNEIATLHGYIQADQWFQKVTWESNDVSTAQTYQEALRDWLDPDLVFKTDPYLQSRYWERLADFYGIFDGDNHNDLQLAALRNSKEALSTLSEIR